MRVAIFFRFFYIFLFAFIWARIISIKLWIMAMTKMSGRPHSKLNSKRARCMCLLLNCTINLIHVVCVKMYVCYACMCRYDSFCWCSVRPHPFRNDKWNIIYECYFWSNFFSLFVFVPFHFAIMHVTKSPSITSRLNLCDVFKSSYSFLQWNDSAVRNGRHKRTQDFSFLLFSIWTLCMMYFSYFFPRLYIFSEHLHPRQSVFEKSNITNLLEMPTIFDVQPLKLDVLTSGGTFSSVDRIILWP